MRIFEIVVPVFFLIILGYVLKRKNIITDSGIATMKNIAVNVFLPAVAFHVLIHGTFTRSSFILIGTEICVLFLAYGSGFFCKRLFDGKVAGYVPFAVTTFEGGMFGWAMVSILVGSENLFYIIPMDMMNGIFCFTIMATGLKMLAGSKMTASETVKSIFTSPVVLAVIAGFIGCAIHLGDMIDSSAFGAIYAKCIGWLTEPLTPAILLCIGSGLVFDRTILAKGIKLVACRFCTMAVLCGLVLLFLSRMIGLFPVLTVSIIMYFFIPSSFLLPMYTNEKESVEFTSGYLSLQIIVSLVMFTIVSVLSQSGVFGVL